VYSGRVRLEVGGVVRLYALRDESALANSYVLPGVTYAAGDVIHVKTEVSGTSPTRVRTKAWLNGDAEPSGWGTSGTDSTAAMQTTGSVALIAAVSGASTNASTHIRFDNYEVVTAG